MIPQEFDKEIAVEVNPVIGTLRDPTIYQTLYKVKVNGPTHEQGGLIEV